jgi:cytochrome c
MELRHCLVTAALTVACSILPACDSASRTQAANDNDAVVSSRGGEADTPAAEPRATPAPVTPAEPAQPANEPAAETQQASSGSGQVKFNNFCRTCHSVREGDNRLGPSLHGIIGKKAGSSPDYPNYSQALARSGIVWDEALLDRFLASPDKTVPGNNMKPYAGLPDAEVRKEIIAYLKTAGDD